jgi:hypothetical protein
MSLSGSETYKARGTVRELFLAEVEKLRYLERPVVEQQGSLSTD